VQNKDGNFEVPTSCVSTPVILTNLACQLALADLVSETGLEQGDAVIARVRAKNEIGWSPTFSNSSDVGPLIVAKPQAPSEAPVRDGPSSSLTSVGINLPSIEGFSTGGLPILSY
jgi:hypothetical protein